MQKKSYKLGSPENKFNNSYLINPLSKCWEWTATIDKNGYGIMSINNKKVRAHRYSFCTKFKTEINGYVICHKCDNKKCVNPEHLFMGKDIDNVNDCISKGRFKYIKKEHLVNLKLKDSDILEIRKLKILGESTKIIANKYKITTRYVNDICTGKTWKNIKELIQEKQKHGSLNGEHNNFSKLNNEQVFQIKNLLKEKEKLATIAKKFNVSDSCVASIRNGRTWSHLNNK